MAIAAHRAVGSRQYRVLRRARVCDAVGIAEEQRPHTAGSPENAAVRDRIIAELKLSGYVPEVQAALQCGPAERNPGCTAVENIIAVHKGTEDGKAVLASAHYDSVPAGPGVSDDGAGVAVVLELARAFAAKTTRNDVIFLITDGEETGLRGARAFAERHPLMRRVGVVVNFEARGASGPSMMFETGPGNARLMDLFTHAVARPSASSVSYEVYKLLPNDTDSRPATTSKPSTASRCSTRANMPSSLPALLPMPILQR
jgi:Zn-dependent M28 family amino/carboxypeptidase